MNKRFFSQANEVIQNPQITEAFGLCREGETSYLAWCEPNSTTLDYPQLYWQDFYEDPSPSDELWGDFLDATNARCTHSMQFLGNIPEISIQKAPARSWKQNFNAWEAFCTKISLGIKGGHFKKVVPSRLRQTELNETDKSIVMEDLFHKISAKAASGSLRFFFKRGNSVFFGITPEILFQRKNKEIYVPAIAGTAVHRENAAVAEENLMNNSKEREEHAFVVEGILATLEDLGLTPLVPTEPKIMRLKNISHLYTPIFAHDPGKLKLTNLDLIRALHPTPAIGGFPQKAAIDFLKKEEPWNRGLFSSPLLFSFAAEDICLVAIRSALIKENKFYQFAGAGFVKDSHTDSEWKETEQKMQTISSIFFEN